jgi:hypothetical protein
VGFHPIRFMQMSHLDPPAKKKSNGLQPSAAAARADGAPLREPGLSSVKRWTSADGETRTEPPSVAAATESAELAVR